MLADVGTLLPSPPAAEVVPELSILPWEMSFFVLIGLVDCQTLATSSGYYHRLVSRVLRIRYGATQYTIIEAEEGGGGGGRKSLGPPMSRYKSLAS